MLKMQLLANKKKYCFEFFKNKDKKSNKVKIVIAKKTTVKGSEIKKTVTSKLVILK